MDIASPGIREITDEEILNVNGGLLFLIPLIVISAEVAAEITTIATLVGACGIGFKIGYEIGKDGAGLCNRRDQRMRAEDLAN
jgi:hypothetical protein